MNRKFSLLLFLLVLGWSSFSQKLDTQGHRGARGLMPENSIPGFLKALDLGVTTLELDLAITKDKKVIVSHEPYMSSSICLDSKGMKIAEGSQSMFNIYNMSYDETQKFDCGSKPYVRFPNQIKMSVRKPLLSDVFIAVEKQIESNSLAKVNYNIEIKSNMKGDDLFHPKPREFCDLVMSLIKDQIETRRITIQSFDFRVLRYMHEKYPDVKLAALVENKKNAQANIQELGFDPHIYSSYHKFLSKKKIKNLQKQGILVIPWTVNKVGRMKKLIAWGVDGIISDYPDRLVVLSEE